MSPFGETNAETEVLNAFTSYVASTPATDDLESIDVATVGPSSNATTCGDKTAETLGGESRHGTAALDVDKLNTGVEFDESPLAKCNALAEETLAPATSLPTESATETLMRVDTMLGRVEACCEEALADFEIPPTTYELPEGFLLSVVIPVFNERETVQSVVARVRALPIPMQIIVVDDASTDGTAEVLSYLEVLPELTVVYKAHNEGKGAALRTGFRYVLGEVVAVQDADLEYDPRDLLRLVVPIVENESDVVFGSRFANNAQPEGSSAVHRWGNRFLTASSNALTGLQLTDMETCYKVFRRSLLDGIELEQDRFGFEPEFTAKMARQKARITEMPISYSPRNWDEGKKIGLVDALNAVYCIARYAWRD